MATIIDVAKLARVSKTSVSRYLNEQDRGHMSDETKERIKDAIEQLNYAPNNAARSLKGKASKVIGLVINDLANPFFLQMIQGIETELRDSGYNILMCDSNLDINREIECLRMLEQRRIDGILIVGVNLPVQHLTDLNIRVPVVLLERDSGDSRVDSVKIDNYSGAYAAVDYLIEKGYEGIAHIRGNQASMMAVQRKEAYQAALREHGYEPVKEYEVDGHYTLEGGYSAMERLMQLKEPPRAVFCANDMSAIGALRYLSQNGYKVPQDMALVGYDDITVASLVTPALTTVRQPVMELAKIGTQILLERMEMKEGDTYSPKSVVLKSELLVRDST